MNISQHNVSNPSADNHEKIKIAAEILSRSKNRKKVFLSIYKGQKKIKTIDDIKAYANLKREDVILRETKRLIGDGLILKSPKKINGRIAYQKENFYTPYIRKIIGFTLNKKNLNKFPTRFSPKINIGNSIRIDLPKNKVKIQQITVDDIDSFSKIKKIKNGNYVIRSEKTIKKGIKKIIGEKGKHKDWGGENDDLFTTRLILKGSRKNVSFAFKGRGKKGILKIKDMGKNGDQIQRLFKQPADIYMVQYIGQIDPSILSEMKTHAFTTAHHDGKKIYYGIIDGIDTDRLIKAYHDFF